MGVRIVPCHNKVLRKDPWSDLGLKPSPGWITGTCDKTGKECNEEKVGHEEGKRRTTNVARILVHDSDIVNLGRLHPSLKKEIEKRKTST